MQQVTTDLNAQHTPYLLSIQLKWEHENEDTPLKKQAFAKYDGAHL